MRATAAATLTSFPGDPTAQSWLTRAARLRPAPLTATRYRNSDTPSFMGAARRSPAWMSANWAAGNSPRGQDLELVVEIRKLLKDFPTLTFAYVRGHNGNHGNELADSLAQEAAESQKGMKGQ